MKYLPSTARLSDEEARQVFGPPDILNGDRRARVARYLLESQNLQASAPGPDRFTLTDTHDVPTGVNTDGEWIWTMDWGYYVLAYGFAPPAEFLRHLDENGGEPKELDRPALIAAMTAFEEDYDAGRGFASPG
jgi:hypothetical protein